MQYKKTTQKWVKDHFTGLRAIRYKLNSWKIDFRPAGARTFLTHCMYEHFFYDKKNNVTYIVMWDEGFIDFGFYITDKPVICVRYEGMAQSNDDLDETAKEYLYHCFEELFNEYDKEITTKEKES